ncbi:MAG: XRE family transcriptional regulator [Bacteroidales bacterium]|nr:XRE family transcriptional regulator [Bacteroidales bacterium]
MEEINHLHIGKMIRQELKNQGRSVTWFAAQLNCHRVNAHNILRRKNIDIELLIRISQILNYNFLEAIAKQL